MQKKLFIVAILLVSFSVLVYAQSYIPKGVYNSPFGKAQVMEKKQEKLVSGNWAIGTSIGYENFFCFDGCANVFTVALNTIYTKKSGFTFWFNNIINLGSSRSTPLLTDQSSYSSASYGYSNPHGNTNSNYSRHRQNFVAGWTGELLLGYSKEIQNHTIRFGCGYQGGANVSVFEFGAFAARLEYLYSFNKKIMFSATLTEAVGGGYIGQVGFMNTFRLEAGVNFKL